MNGYDPGDYDQARNIWWNYRNRKKKGGKPYTDRDIAKLIAKAAELGMWEMGGKFSIPSETQVRTWIKEKWEPMAKILPKDEVVLPWREDWGPEPARIRTLTVLFDLAYEIWEKEKAVDSTMESEFPGFPNGVCDWAWKLSGFFDLMVRLDCFVLLDFSYDFAYEQQYRQAFDEPMPIRNEKYDRLMRWNNRNQYPDLTRIIRDTKGVVSIPIWEQPNERAMEWIIASKLKGEPLVISADDAGFLIPQLEVAQPGDLKRIVSEIEEPKTTSNAPVGLLIAQPEDIPDVADQIPEQFWPLLEAQGWQRPTKEADGE